MEIEDFRWSALARYHDAALENAVVLLALSRCPVHSHFDDYPITGPRTIVRMMTETHAFCQNARKALEVSNVIDNKILPAAYQAKLYNAGDAIKIFGEESTVITDQSFMWILGRIIHSLSVAVHDETAYLGQHGRRIYSEIRRKYFAFGSDKDEPSAAAASYVVSAEKMHYIDIDALLKCYTGHLSNLIEAAIKALRPPLTP